MANIGIDFHDTLSYAPEFFKSLMTSWQGGKCFIVTGTPIAERTKTINILSDEYGIEMGIHYEDILMGYDYDKSDGLDTSHFDRMKEQKLKNIKDNNITIFYDDNPYYVDYMKDHGVITFQMILPKEYTERFAKDDPYFTCHLQDKQFDFIHNQKDKTDLLKPNHDLGDAKSLSDKTDFWGEGACTDWI